MLRLVLIGTGHVFRIGETISEAIQAIRPDAVFVELDAQRLQGLRQKAAGIDPPARGGFIQRRLQAFQEKLAKSYGAQAGEEMLAAVDAGALVGARVGLIDRPIGVTIQRLRKITMRERLRFLGDFAKGLLGRASKADVEKQLRDYVRDPDAALLELGKDYPTVRRVLIDERDDWMAQRIRAAADAGALTAVAVVGDGHVPGLMERLQEYELEVYRLPDVRADRLPRRADTQSFAFSFTYEPTQGI